jgi:hypothetical protein
MMTLIRKKLLYEVSAKLTLVLSIQQPPYSPSLQPVLRRSTISSKLFHIAVNPPKPGLAPFDSFDVSYHEAGLLKLPQ